MFQTDVFKHLFKHTCPAKVKCGPARRRAAKRSPRRIGRDKVNLRQTDASERIAGTDVGRDILLRKLQQQVEPGNPRGDRIQNLHTLFNGQLEVYEYEVTEGFRYIGKRLREIDFKGKLTIAGVRRSGGKDNFIPDGNYMILSGDTLILAATHADYAYVEKLMTAR